MITTRSRRLEPRDGRKRYRGDPNSPWGATPVNPETQQEREERQARTELILEQLRAHQEQRGTVLGPQGLGVQPIDRTEETWNNESVSDPIEVVDGDLTVDSDVNLTPNPFGMPINFSSLSGLIDNLNNNTYTNRDLDPRNWYVTSGSNSLTNSSSRTMKISDSFKSALLEFGEANLEKINLKNLNDMPNEDIVANLKKVFQSDKFRGTALGEVGGRNNLRNVNPIGIDNEYIWADNSDMYRWVPILAHLKSIMDSDQPKFEEGDVVKGLPSGKMTAICSNNGVIIRLTGKFFKCVGYSRSDDDYSHLWTERGMGMYIEDAYGSIYYVSQELFVKTRYKDLKKAEEKRIRGDISRRIKNNMKKNSEQIRADYAKALREFMAQARLLSENNAGDIDALVDKELETTMNFGTLMKKNEMVVDADCKYGDRIIITTGQIYVNGDSNYPVGRYEIVASLNQKNFSIKMKNLTLADARVSGEHQHPHVHADGRACLGEYAPILKKYLSAGDYVMFGNTLIDFLQHFNERDPYIQLGDFLDNWEDLFQKELRAERKENGEMTEEDKQLEEEEKKRKEQEEEAKKQAEAERQAESGSFEKTVVRHTTGDSQTINFVPFRP